MYCLFCVRCREAHDEFQVVANSWRYCNHYTSELFFVMVDIDEGGVEAFQQVRSYLFNIRLICKIVYTVKLV